MEGTVTICGRLNKLYHLGNAGRVIEIAADALELMIGFK